MHLLWLNFKVGVFNFIEFLKVLFFYYPRLSFAKWDLSLLRGYIQKTPFKVSKQYLACTGESNVYQYGETPLTTLDRITCCCKVSKEDVVYELGCGRGRTCFWLRNFIGCKVVGIEYVSYFVEQANRVVQAHHLEGIDFRCKDMLKANLSKATVIYFYGTCSEESFVEALTKKIPKGVKVITVSYPLPGFEVQDCFEASFPWGVAEVYVQISP